MAISTIPHWIDAQAAEIGTQHEVRNPPTTRSSRRSSCDVDTAAKVASTAHETFLRWSQVSPEGVGSVNPANSGS